MSLAETGLLCRLGTAGRLGHFHGFGDDPRRHVDLGLDCAGLVVESTTWVTMTAAVWLTLVTIVVTRGIKHASYTQVFLTGLETAVIFALIIAAFVQYGGKPAHPPSLIWFSPFSFTPQLFATGALTAIFFYWGWDVTMNLTEETKGGTPDPASAALFGPWSI